ncbi:magnesium/cobalt transporter CorA [Candidatus Woesearchaeota archaeon]|nr:magnesium/cobalt transporter CorA [Candidatus Woesearchaeota archaeon]
MINLTYLSDGKVMHGSLDEIGKIKSEVWIKCISPSKAELKEISEKTGIAYEDMARAIDENERPGIYDFEEYSVLTFHAPFLNKNKNYVTVPVTIIIKNNVILLLSTRALESLQNIELLDDRKKIDVLEHDVTFTIYIILSEIVNHFFRISDELDDAVDRIEETVFRKHTERTVKAIFSLKKTLIYFHKSLTGNREVITGIEKQFLKEIKGRNLKKFRYLYNDVIQLIDMVATYRDILTGSLDIYLTSVSNDLNEIVRKLTVMAAFVMVPTLISGIYGMNFQYMPEIHNWGIYGYPFALGMMVLSIIITYIFFKRRGWI